MTQADSGLCFRRNSDLFRITKIGASIHPLGSPVFIPRLCQLSGCLSHFGGQAHCGPHSRLAEPLLPALAWLDATRGDLSPPSHLPCTCNVRCARAVCLLWFLGSPRERRSAEPSRIQILSGCNAAVSSQHAVSTSRTSNIPEQVPPLINS